MLGVGLLWLFWLLWCQGRIHRPVLRLAPGPVWLRLLPGAARFGAVRLHLDLSPPPPGAAAPDLCTAAAGAGRGYTPPHAQRQPLYMGDESHGPAVDGWSAQQLRRCAGRHPGHLLPLRLQYGGSYGGAPGGDSAHLALLLQPHPGGVLPGHAGLDGGAGRGPASPVGRGGSGRASDL